MTEQTVKMMEKTFEEIKKDKTIKGVCLLAMDEKSTPSALWRVVMIILRSCLRTQ